MLTSPKLNFPFHCSRISVASIALVGLIVRDYLPSSIFAVYKCHVVLDIIELSLFIELDVIQISSSS